MNKRLCLFLFLSLSASLGGHAQDGWVLKKEKDGIKVYSRSAEHSKFNELKAELTIKAKLSDLAALILDIPDYYKWSFNTKLSYVLKKVSPSELYFYTEIRSPWPASNRDLAVHLQILQDPHSKIMTIKAEGIPNYIPPKDGIVRVPLSKEYWTVTPLDPTTLRIEYQIQIDPGASAPAWLINAFATKGPYETFKNLSEKIRDAKYRNTAIPFITN